jgi:hypothetical protein
MTPTGWRPKPGDTISGVVTDLAVCHGEHGSYPLVELDGTTNLHAFHEVLRNELARRSPKIGDRLEVTYQGRHPERDYHVYRVTSNADIAFDWGVFGGPPVGGGPGSEPNAGPDREEEDDGDLPF